MGGLFTSLMGIAVGPPKVWELTLTLLRNLLENCSQRHRQLLGFSDLQLVALEILIARGTEFNGCFFHTKNRDFTKLGKSSHSKFRKHDP